MAGSQRASRRRCDREKGAKAVNGCGADEDCSDEEDDDERVSVEKENAAEGSSESDWGVSAKDAVDDGREDVVWYMRRCEEEDCG